MLNPYKALLHDMFWQTCFEADDKIYRVKLGNHTTYMSIDGIEIVLFALSDIYVFEEFNQSEIRPWGYSINSTTLHVRHSRDFCNLLNINNIDKENNMMGFGINETWVLLRNQNRNNKATKRKQFWSLHHQTKPLQYAAAFISMHTGITKL